MRNADLRNLIKSCPRSMRWISDHADIPACQLKAISNGSIDFNKAQARSLIATIISAEKWGKPVEKEPRTISETIDFLRSHCSKDGRRAVYFILCPELKRVKIGISSRVENRLESFVIHSPSAVKMLGSVFSTEEKVFHAAFSKERLHREWFKYTRKVEQVIAGVLKKNPSPTAVGMQQIINAAELYRRGKGKP